MSDTADSAIERFESRDSREESTIHSDGPEPPSGWPAVELDQRGWPREQSHGGRPSLYTLPRVLVIIGELFDGASRAEAAKRAGVGVSTLYVWLNLGRRGHPTYAPFAETVELVEHGRSLNLAFRHAFSRRRFWSRSL